MPSTFNGIGTKYVGASQRKEDNSFITTTWFCIFIPLFPLKSERVIYRGKTGVYHFASSRETDFYTVLEKVKLDTKQILKYYGISAILLFLPIIVGSLMYGSNNSDYGAIFGVTIILLLAWWFLLAVNLIFKPK